MVMEQIEGDSLEVRLRWCLYVLVFIDAFAIIILRRPDAILHPQFWAEDGFVWYANAYNLGGIRSLFLPMNGYFQTTSRLIAALSQIFPFSIAPLIFNVVAIIIQILPVILIISSRFSPVMPNLNTRMFLSFIYLVLPNSGEIHANLTNAQWHLALLAFMVIVAEPSDRPLWRCFDIGVVLLSGLSGPFSLLLTPIAALRWWLRREKWLHILFLLTGTCAIIQTACLALNMHSSRSHMFLGATPKLFDRILSGQVFLGALIGQRGYEWFVSHYGLNSMFALIIAMIGLAVVINALLKTPIELRLFILFAILIFCSALIAPQVSDVVPQWQALSTPGWGVRYWFIPMLAFLTILVWMLGRLCSSMSRVFALLLLSIMAIGIILDWQYPPYTDFHFREYVHKFELSRRGEEVTIPINPPGWSMTLTKH
jgi:hypothetical protein